MVNVYGYDPEGGVFDYVVTYHRSNVICRMLTSGEWWTIDEDIKVTIPLMATPPVLELKSP